MNTRIAHTLSLVVACLLMTLSSVNAQEKRAVSADELASTPNPFKFEPTAAQTVKKALAYFRVSPEAFDRLRSAANTRAWLPTLAAGYRFYDLDSSLLSQDDIVPFDTREGRNDRYHSFTIGAIWDFRQLVFNPSEVQVYGLVGVQRDVMLEVVRTFFLRRQLVLRLALRPPQEPLARASLELRIDEFTGILDVLTGAWFSQEATRRSTRAQKAKKNR